MYFFPWALKAASSEQSAPFLPLPPVLGVELELGAALAAADEEMTTALDAADEGIMTALVASVSGSGAAEGVGVLMTVSSVDGTATEGATEGLGVTVVAGVFPPLLPATHWEYQSLYFVQVQPLVQVVSPE